MGSIVIGLAAFVLVGCVSVDFCTQKIQEVGDICKVKIQEVGDFCVKEIRSLR